MNAARPASTGTVCRWTTTRISTAWPSEARLRMPCTVSLNAPTAWTMKSCRPGFGRVERDASHDVGKADRRELGIPHGTARSRRHYALDAMRKQLEKHDAIAAS